MSWLSTLIIALLNGVLGLIVTALVASACVAWFRISSFEGGAGYFVVLTAVAGAVVAFIIGLVTCRLVAAGAAPGFFKALGYSAAIVAGLGGITTTICYLLADIPPKISGQELMLEVELRLPVGSAEPSASATDKSKFSLGSSVNHVRRAFRDGELKLTAARLVDGRWVIPASAFLFTRRGYRSIDFGIGGERPFGFLVPLPARPGEKFEEWSDWYPRPPAGEAPWPDTKTSFRFRVQRIQPPPPPRDPADIEAEQFAALKPDAPLEQWLASAGNDAPDERKAAVMKMVEGRLSELAKLIRSSDEGVREAALTAVVPLAQVTPEITEAVVAEGKDIADALRKFNEMKAEEPRFIDVQIALRGRFNYWKRAWWTVHRRIGVDGRPPVQEIHDLALVRAKDTTISEIVVNARAILDALAPPAK